MKETLDDFLESPILTSMPFGDHKVEFLSKYLRESAKTIGNVTAEDDALNFYMANHVVALARLELHPDKVVPEHWRKALVLALEIMTTVSARLYAYMVTICVRETRHIGGSSEALDDIQDKYDMATKNFLCMIQGQDSGMVVKKIRNSPPDTTIANLFGGLTYLFNKGSWGAGYGGEAWGKVSQVLYDCARGKVSLEVLCDTGFTLAHNNGPIFNKGYFYSGYENSSLVPILDAQRAGMIPNLLWSHRKGQEYIHIPTSPLILYDRFKELLGAKVSGPINWRRVQELGAVWEMSGFIKKQDSLYHVEFGVKPKVPVIEGVYFEVAPGIKVKKMTRKQLLMSN